MDNKKKTKKRDSKGKIKSNNNGESSNFNHRNELNEENHNGSGMSLKMVVYTKFYQIPLSNQ